MSYFRSFGAASPCQGCASCTSAGASSFFLVPNERSLTGRALCAFHSGIGSARVAVCAEPFVAICRTNRDGKHPEIHRVPERSPSGEGVRITRRDAHSQGSHRQGLVRGPGANSLFYSSCEKKKKKIPDTLLLSFPSGRKISDNKCSLSDPFLQSVIFGALAVPHAVADERSGQGVCRFAGARASGAGSKFKYPAGAYLNFSRPAARPAARPRGEGRITAPDDSAWFRPRVALPRQVFALASARVHRACPGPASRAEQRSENVTPPPAHPRRLDCSGARETGSHSVSERRFDEF